MSAKELFQMFNAKLVMADSTMKADKSDDATEAFTLTFVEKGLNIWDKVSLTEGNNDFHMYHNLSRRLSF